MNTEIPVNQPVPAKATRPPQHDRLIKYLHGAVFLCDKDGNALDEAVDFFIIEADKSLEGQYSAPFENSNPE